MITTQPPSSVVAGSPMTIRVEVQNSGGVKVNTNTTVLLALTVNSNGATLGGTVSKAAVNGVAEFTDITVDKVGSGYVLNASGSNLFAGSNSNTFAVTAGPPVKLAFATQPNSRSSMVAGTPVYVTVQDAGGNQVLSATSSITLSITAGSGAAGAVLGGTLTRSAVTGAVMFDDITIDKAGTGYTMSATASGLTSATSGTFAVTVGAPSKLAFTAQPSTVGSGANISPAVKVTVQDAGGNKIHNSASTIVLSITSGTGAAGAALSGTTTASADTGVATFDNVSIDKVGTAYTLRASASGLTSATSSAFNVGVGAAAKLGFVVQPSNVGAGAGMNPAMQVAVTDAGGNTIATATNAVTLAITSGTGTSGAALGGTLTRNAVNGIATFDSVSVDKIGSNYTLRATATGLTLATSTAFSVSAGAPASLGFKTQPQTGSGLSINTLEVSVRDAGGNTVTTATTAITIALGNNPTSASLSGTTTANAVNGVATFSGMSVDKAGQGITLTASATGLTAATSTAFNAIGPAAKLAFSVQPVSGIRNAAITPSIVVVVQDAVGNTVNTGTSVTLTIGNNAGGGTLSGTATRNASSGVATFNDLSIDAAGNGYTLAASASGLTGATSDAFNLAAFGAANKLAFTVQPSNAIIATVISPAVQVAILDAVGNAVTTSSQSVTLAFGANPGSGTLGGAVSAAAVSGVATFSDLTVSAGGSNYTLVASATSLTSATSATFNVVDPNAAIKLGFVQQPTSTTAGSTLVPAVTVAIQNGSGATVTSDNSTVVSITVASGPPGGTVKGTLSATAVNGIATFSTLSDTVAGPYTLRASAPGLTSGTSAAYTISAGVASKLSFLQQPTDARAGDLFSSVVRVAVNDSYGNIVPSATNTVTIYVPGPTCCLYDLSWVLRYPYGTSGFTLAGTLTVAAINGVASFPDLRNRHAYGVNGDYFRATSLGMPDVNSASFTVSPSAPTHLWVSVPNVQNTNPWTGGTQTANVAFIASAVILDSLGNQVNAGSNLITLAVSTNPSSAVLSTESNIVSTNGRADFHATIDKGGNGFTLVASTAGLTSIPSLSFNVAAFGTASRLGFTVQPTNSTVGVAISPSVKVCVQDGVGNTVTTATNSITIAISANPGSATLGGTATAAAVSGCATFADLTLSAAGSGYMLGASATGLLASTSAAFNVNP